MNKGPMINNISRNFTTRDSLGIEGVATSISAELCPIVNTVTPRPFYWAFIIWCFYDFYKNCNPEDRKIENVYKYVKMQNYFLALGSLLNNNYDVSGFTGTDTIKNTVDLTSEKYDYNENYLKTTLSNMGYYPAGLFSMYFITDENAETGEKYKYPKFTPLGEKLAMAFESVICKTDYYLEFRKTGINVTKNSLIQLNNFVNLDLKIAIKPSP